MKVCFLVGTLGRGGAERQLLYMLDALGKCAIETRVLCLTEGEPFETVIRAKGVAVEWIGKSQNRLARLAAIVNNLRKNPPDILQSSHFYTNIYAGLAGKVLNIPSIGAIRSDLESEIRLHKKLGRFQVSLPGSLITNSMPAYERALERGVSAERIRFVQNVVEAAANGDLRKSGDTDRDPVLLFVGRLDENKRPGLFVELASVLTGKFPEIALRFRIAGDGVLREKLEKKALEFNLTPERMQFLGNCPDMSGIYAGADILISTSVLEGTSNVILEAMSYGLPVIAARVGGTPDILDETRGILTEPGNMIELIDAASKLIADPELRKTLGASGKKYVEEHHSIEYLGKQLTAIYESITNGK